jgi:hypothetical protein
MKFFYHRRDEEIEVDGPARVDAEDGEPEVALLMRLDVRLRSYKLGERLALSVVDFDEIAFACYYFGSQLATRLRKLGDAPR